MTSYEYQATCCYNIQQHLRKRWYIEISNKCDKHLMVSNSSCFPWILIAGLHTIALFIELFNCVGLTCSLVCCDISCFCKHKKQSHKNMRWGKFFTWWVQKQFDGKNIHIAYDFLSFYLKGTSVSFPKGKSIMANQIWVSYLPSFIFKQSIHHTL